MLPWKISKRNNLHSMCFMYTLLNIDPFFLVDCLPKHAIKTIQSKNQDHLTNYSLWQDLILRQTEKDILYKQN